MRKLSNNNGASGVDSFRITGYTIHLTAIERHENAYILTIDELPFYNIFTPSLWLWLLDETEFHSSFILEAIFCNVSVIFTKKKLPFPF